MTLAASTNSNHPRTARPHGIQREERMGWTFPQWGAVRVLFAYLFVVGVTTAAVVGFVNW